MTNYRIAGQETPVRVADTLLEQARGNMFRRSPPDEPLVFEFGGVSHHLFHMLCVPFALDAVFVVDGVVVQVSRLRPWVGTAFGQADTVIEVPPGELDVAVGDEVRRVESR